MEENGLTAEPGFLIALLFFGICLASYLMAIGIEAGVRRLWRKMRRGHE